MKRILEIDPVWPALAVQSLLLFCCLDLLPMWGDERHTMFVVAWEPSQILRSLGRDIHPPLYFFLVQLWLKIAPWNEPLLAARALSALCVLLLTAWLNRCWAARLSPISRALFLSLWVLSPCVLLFGRMARSYALAALLASVVLHEAFRFIEEPSAWRRLVRYSVANVVLLYVHYLPGVAIAAAVALLLIVRSIRSRRVELLQPLAASTLVMTLGYAPWLPTLWNTMTRLPARAPIAAGEFTDHALRLAYWFVSFSFGESLPIVSIAAGAALAPLILWLLAAGLRQQPPWTPTVLVSTAVAYVGVATATAFPFVGARMLFVLPFFLLLLVWGRARSPRLGTLIIVAMLVLNISGVASYYQKAGFLNKGYLVSYEEMNEVVAQAATSHSTVLVRDRLSLDIWPLVGLLPRSVGVANLLHKSPEKAAETILASNADRVFYVRAMRDLADPDAEQELDLALAEQYESHVHRFVPYGRADRWAMAAFGWKARPSHAIELIELRRR